MTAFAAAAAALERQAGLPCGRCQLPHASSSAVAGTCCCCEPCRRLWAEWVGDALVGAGMGDLLAADGRITAATLSEAIRRMRAEVARLEGR